MLHHKETISSVASVTGDLSYSGILKLTLPQTPELYFPSNLTKNTKMHITLVSPDVFRKLNFNQVRFDKWLKNNPVASQEVTIDIDTTSGETFIMEDNDKHKEVYVYFLTRESQLSLNKLVQDFFSAYGLQEQFNSIRPHTKDYARIFHLSYANLSGNPHDSIAVVW